MGHAGFLPARAGGPGKASVFWSNSVLGSGKVWAGITRWHCYTVFQVLFLPVRVNVQSWQDRQRWSSLGLCWYRARAKGVGLGRRRGARAAPKRPRRAVGAQTPLWHWFLWTDDMSQATQLLLCPLIMQMLFTLVTSRQRRDFGTRLEEDKTGQHCLEGIQGSLWDGLSATSQVAEH